MIGIGRLVANLYFQDIESLTLQDDDYKVAASVISMDLWHKRLGHPSLIRLQSLQPLLSFPKQKLDMEYHCKTCHRAKQNHLKNPLSLIIHLVKNHLI